MRIVAVVVPMTCGHDRIDLPPFKLRGGTYEALSTWVIYSAEVGVIVNERLTCRPLQEFTLPQNRRLVLPCAVCATHCCAEGTRATNFRKATTRFNRDNFPQTFSLLSVKWVDCENDNLGWMLDEAVLVSWHQCPLIAASSFSITYGRKAGIRGRWACMVSPVYPAAAPGTRIVSSSMDSPKVWVSKLDSKRV